MKIGIVCYPTYGGSGVVATELGLEMAAIGHQVHFISYSKPVRLDLSFPNVFYHEVVITDYPLFDYSPYELVLTSKLVDVVKSEKLDLLHVHYAIPHASAAYMAKQILKSFGIDLPIVCTLHGTDITLVGRDSSFEPVITFAMNQSDAVTAVSESLKNDTLSYFNTTAHIHVIPNFINLERYKRNKNNKLRRKFAEDDVPILMHTSNFRKVKKVPDVVKVFAKVREEIDAKLILIGDGPERNNVERLCKSLRTHDDIFILGKVQKIEEMMSIGDLFILPSETESFGLAALEAMASGMPVISTNTGGLPEVNLQGLSGYLSNVGDIEEMSMNILNILSSKNQLEKFRMNALEQAAKFELKNILPLYLKIYNEILI